MGLYDTIACEYILPPEFAVVQHEDFQTKDLGCQMDEYTITDEGRLILHRWEDPLFRLAGCLRSIPVGDEDTAFHGDLVLYATHGCRDNGNWEWYEFRLRFTHGQLKSLTRI